METNLIANAQNFWKYTIQLQLNMVGGSFPSRDSYSVPASLVSLFGVLLTQFYLDGEHYKFHCWFKATCANGRGNCLNPDCHPQGDASSVKCAPLRWYRSVAKANDGRQRLCSRGQGYKMLYSQIHSTIFYRRWRLYHWQHGAIWHRHRSFCLVQYSRIDRLSGSVQRKRKFHPSPLDIPQPRHTLFIHRRTLRRTSIGVRNPP